ncbi:MAG: hypothetical protein DRI80_09635, partial [Chloroflexota bacterium]
LSHPAELRIGRRFAQIFADKIKKSAFISVHLRPKEYVSTLCLGMAGQLLNIFKSQFDFQ